MNASGGDVATESGSVQPGGMPGASCSAIVHRHLAENKKTAATRRVAQTNTPGGRLRRDRYLNPKTGPNRAGARPGSPLATGSTLTTGFARPSAARCVASALARGVD